MHGLILALVMTHSAILAASTPIHEGGLCVGLGWVALRHGEKVYIDHGLDFDVFHFQDENGAFRNFEWNVYAGYFSGVSVSSSNLKSDDKLHFHRVGDGADKGYIVVKKGFQNFFYGPAFEGVAPDKYLFDRVNFSARGKSLCEKYRK